VTLLAGQQTQVPLQMLAYPRAGGHSVGVEAEASYLTGSPGEAMVGPVSIIVTELPR
jgi:hypothetical protein